MPEVSRRLPRVLAATTLLVVCPALIVSIPSPDDGCKALRKFGQAYLGTSPTLDHLATLDRSRRAAVLSVLSPAVRASLWQAHLKRFSQRPDLTPTQRRLAEEGMAVATIQLFERRPEAVRAKHRFWSRAETAFNSRELRAPWYDLAAGHSPVSSRPSSLLDRIAQPFTANAQWLPGCSCNTSSECGIDESCHGSPCRMFYGCGPLGDELCTGRCQAP